LFEVLINLSEILPQMDEDDGPWFKSRTSRTIASRIWFHLLSTTRRD